MEILAVHQLKKRRLIQEKLRKEQELLDQLAVKEEDVDRAKINKLFGLPDPPSEIFALGRDSSCALWWTYDSNLLADNEEVVIENTIDSESTKIKLERESSTSSINSNRIRRNSLLSDMNKGSTRVSVKMSKRKLKQLEEELELKKKLQQEIEEREIQDIMDEAKNKGK